MKKLLFGVLITFLFSFLFALPWAQRYDTWQTWASKSIQVDESVIFAVEWGEGGWDGADGSQVGYGTSADGTGWLWTNINWVQDGEGTNKRCSTVVIFNSPGKFYYAFKIVKAASGGTSYNSGHNGWSENSSTLVDKISTEYFYVTVTDGQVPITLASFSAAALNGSVSVTWVTESESENAHFLLYRDGEVIAQIAGAGTSSEPHSYAYTDRYVVPGRTYTYQLADVSFDGGETKHNEVEVELKAEGVDRDYTIGAAYPNPFNPLTVVPVNLAKDAVVTATLFDLTSRPLSELHNGTLSAGSHAITINGANLSTGIYFVRVRVNDATHVQKIALMK